MAGFIKASHDALDTVSHTAAAIAKGAKLLDAHMQFMLDEHETLRVGKLQKLADNKEFLAEKWFQETYGS
jgi:hypothetical protein